MSRGQDPQDIFFPGGERIWDPRNYHPEAGKGSPSGIEALCQPYIDPDVFNMGLPYANAFMLNRPPRQDEIDAYTLGQPGGEYFACWRQVHVGMLSYGVSTEACAQYTWGDGAWGWREGMRGSRSRMPMRRVCERGGGSEVAMLAHHR